MCLLLLLLLYFQWRFQLLNGKRLAVITLLPCPPLLLEVLLCRAWAVLSRRLSRALKLLETATLALVSLAESTLELPRRRPHLLARVLRADGGPDEGEGDGDGEGTAAVVRMRESSVNVSLAGSFLDRLIFVFFLFFVLFIAFVYLLTSSLRFLSIEFAASTRQQECREI